MFGLVFSKRKRVQKIRAQKMLSAVNGFARSQAFYKELGVPDTMTGRFDLISLVASFVIIRLKQMETQESQAMAQRFFDVMFRQFDYSLRESGVGDLGVPKHMKRMMQGIQGRTHFYEMAYIGGVDENGKALNMDDKLDILNRNLYSGVMDDSDSQLAACHDVIASLANHIMARTDQDILLGELSLPAYDELLMNEKSAA
jgi:cytochrome b pre-mRNA-processing protein 3